jgi:hypothetical protein
MNYCHTPYRRWAGAGSAILLIIIMALAAWGTLLADQAVAQATQYGGKISLEIGYPEQPIFYEQRQNPPNPFPLYLWKEYKPPGSTCWYRIWSLSSPEVFRAEAERIGPDTAFKCTKLPIGAEVQNWFITNVNGVLLSTFPTKYKCVMAFVYRHNLVRNFGPYLPPFIPTVTISNSASTSSIPILDNTEHFQWVSFECSYVPAGVMGNIISSAGITNTEIGTNLFYFVEGYLRVLEPEQGYPYNLTLKDVSGNRLNVEIFSKPGGFRTGIRKGEEAPFFVGGCFYSDGRNSSYLTGDGKFVWINYSGEAGVGTYDAYIYDPKKHFLNIKSYPTLDALKTATNNMTGTPTSDSDEWGRPPPTDSEKLAPKCRRDPTCWNSEASLAAIEGATDASTTKTFSPMSTLALNQYSGGEWAYGLDVNQDWGARVTPQVSTITITGTGIKSAAVEGNAATPAYGAWQVLSVSDRQVVFVATTDAVFSGRLDSLVITTDAAMKMGKVNYEVQGYWLGRNGEVNGPVGKAMPWVQGLLLD